MSINHVERPGSVPALKGESRQGCGSRKRLPGLSGFVRAEDGGVATTFAIASLGMMALIGGAIDLGRVVSSRDKAQEVMDAAVLAGAQTFQTNGGNAAAATAVAQKYYDQNIKSVVFVNSSTPAIFSFSTTSSTLTGSFTGSVATPFISFCCTSSFPVSARSAATLAVGGNAETNLEISMMLDVSGSMAGQKLLDLKSAANDAIDILVWADQTKYTSKVALVPFSGDVRPAPEMFRVVTDGSTADPLRVNSNGNKYDYYKTECVAERSGNNKYNDAAAGRGSYVLVQRSRSDSCSTPGGGTNRVNEVLALTANKTTLHDRINRLQNGGATAGQVGTAWAYYMLSPNWATTQGWQAAVGADSVPKAYGTDKLSKIAVLMTDGEFNSEHDANGITVGDSGSGNAVNTGRPANNSGSPDQAKAICADMKSKGIEVYTVGFQVSSNQTAISTLSDCATDAAHFYKAENGDQLRQAFRNIALKISDLYVSK